MGLSKTRNVLGKFITHWMTIACTSIVVLWFTQPSWNNIYRGTPPQFDDGVPIRSQHHRFPPPPSYTEQKIWHRRKEEVREAFQHAWEGYMDRAFPNDELLSLSGGFSNRFNGWAVTVFDSLDTLWIMDLREEFEEAVESISEHDFNATKPDHYVPFFETTIRYLGGLLSAHALSGESILLELAEKMAQRLLPAFDETKSGLPAFSVNVETGETNSEENRDTVLFSEATSCQLEFKYLAKLTGKKFVLLYHVQTAMNIFYSANVSSGLFHDMWSAKDGKPRGEHFTVGATADSGYEYLLKQWLLEGDEVALQQYLKSIDGIINNLIYITPTRGLMYVGDLQNGEMVHRLEHLSCYLPGLMALGAATLDLPPDIRELHLLAAHGLAYTCAISYADQLTGLGPDLIVMSDGKKWIDEMHLWEDGGRVGKAPGVMDPPVEKDSALRDYNHSWPSAYLLRPETVESIFYMWRTTGDVKWRERGYAIFKAINKHTLTQFGFSSVYNVDSAKISQTDEMPSYFLAETLKYLYLLFDDPRTIGLDRWVFNTEAHPFPVFEWDDDERAAFKISPHVNQE